MVYRVFYYFTIFVFSLISLTADGYPTIRLGSSTLKTVNLFFRHGARTPLLPAPKNAQFGDLKWSEGAGVLTKVGKEKMFELGLVLREMYKDFLSPYYSPEEIRVTTTPMERTSTSAKALLAGLYNTRGYTKWRDDIPLDNIPVFDDNDTVDKSNIINSPNACPVFRSEQNVAVAKARANDKGFEDVYSYLSLYAGSKMYGMYDIFPIWDILECLAHTGQKLPDWASFIYPTRMSLIQAKVLRSLIVGTKKMIRLSAGPYMAEVHKQFTDAVLKSPTSKKLIVHGGHDFSMTANLAALGIFEKIVNPSEAMMLELHEIPFAGYFVQLLYAESGGSKITVVPIKDCGQPCPLHKFIQLTEEFVPKSWNLECFSSH